MQKKLTPFDVERTRANLAQRLEFDELRKMYTTVYPQIPDQNSPNLWNVLNLNEKPLITSNPMEDERLKIVTHFIKGANLQILNIGFGSGNLEQTYFSNHTDKNIHWYGIDISEKSVDKVQHDYPKGKFSVGNILNLKFPKDHFDYVTSLEVLEHIPPSHIMNALSEVFQILKQGGFFILSVPLNEGLEEMIARGENPNAHVRVYTPELIEAELRLAGFRILDENLLFAFHTLHNIKSFIAKYSIIKKWKPNNIVILAQKPDSLGCRTLKYERS